MSKIRGIKGAVAAEPQPAAVRGKSAARYLGVSYGSVRLMVKRGELPSRRIGRCRIFLLEDLNDFLRSRPTEGELSGS